MVKDEDLCVHCGLCAERCPTAAWDMQKSTINLQIRHRPHMAHTAPAPRPPKRLRHQARQRQRHGLGQRQRAGDEGDLPMGIPVMGKNYFPSNIRGLPTWYEIRVTRDGYVARSPAST